MNGVYKEGDKQGELLSKLQMLTVYCEEQANNIEDKSPHMQGQVVAYSHTYFKLRECLNVAEKIRKEKDLKVGNFYVLIPLISLLIGIYSGVMLATLIKV